jgi:hypothetical protein
MKIQDQDLYHGAALTQIVEHASFKALNRGSEKYGHYLVNKDQHVFIKYRTAGGTSWTFTMQGDELKAIRDQINGKSRVFLCLVCGDVTVCALDQDQIASVIDLKSSTSQWIKVTVPAGKSCRVSGSQGSLQRVIPHNSFPEKIFG